MVLARVPSLPESRFEGITAVVDPDAIASSLDPERPSRAGIAAGRQAILRCRSSLAVKDSFVLESTLAGNGAIGLMREAKQAGYRILLVYVALSDPELHIERVRLLVARGGMTSRILIYGGDTAAVCCVRPKPSVWQTKLWFLTTRAWNRDESSCCRTATSYGRWNLYPCGSKEIGVTHSANPFCTILWRTTAPGARGLTKRTQFDPRSLAAGRQPRSLSSAAGGKTSQLPMASNVLLHQ